MISLLIAFVATLDLAMHGHVLPYASHSLRKPRGSQQGAYILNKSMASSTGESVIELSKLSFSALEWWWYIIGLAIIFILTYISSFAIKKITRGTGNSKKIVAVLISVIIVYCAFVLLLLWNQNFENIPERLRDGTFGDSFGTLNALFSGLAFSGVLITLLLQRQDLSDAREQSSTQQIESQFYNMLNLQQQVIQGFDLHVSRNDSSVLIQGRDCFKSWYRKLRMAHATLRVTDKDSDELSRAIKAYDKIFRSHQGDLGLYFRSLYSVFRFIEKSKHIDKSHFSSVVRSLLSDYELIFLFYNCLSERGEKFKVFAVNYALFDNIDVKLLLRATHVTSMDRKAFGKNESVLALFDK